MATKPVSNFYPAPMPWQAKARNAKTPDWSTAASIAHRMQFALQHQRKVVFQWTGSPILGNPDPQAGAHEQWRWKCHLGENTESGDTMGLLAVVTLLPPVSMTTAGAGNPRWRLVAGANSSDYVRLPIAPGSPTYDDVATTSVLLDGLSPDTEYDCYLEYEGFARILSACVYEVPTLADGVDLDHTTAVLDHRPYRVDGEVTGSQHAQLYDIPYRLYRHNHAHGFNLVQAQTNTPWTRTTNSYANLLDQTVTGSSAGQNTPGVNLEFQHHTPAHKNTMTCVFAAYGTNASSAGGGIKLVDSDGDVSGSELTGFSTAGEWKKATVEITSNNDLSKLDVQFQGDGSNVFTVEAVSLYPYISDAQSLQLTAASSQYTTWTDSVPSLTGNALTISFSMLFDSLPTSSGSYTIVSKYGASGDRVFLVDVQEDGAGGYDLRFNVSSDGAAARSFVSWAIDSIVVDTAYDVVLTWDGTQGTTSGQFSFSLDGVDQGAPDAVIDNDAVATMDGSSTRPVQIGASHDGVTPTNYFDGRIDEFKLWLDLTQTTLEIHWKFDGDFQDSSGNGRTASGVNSPTFGTALV